MRKSKNVEYISFVAQEKLFDLLQSSFITINSSKSEGQSAAVLESMSFGVPVLARNIPGNSSGSNIYTIMLLPSRWKIKKIFKSKK